MSTLLTLAALTLMTAEPPPAGPILKLGGLIQPELVMAFGDVDDVFTNELRFRRLRPMLVASWGIATLRLVPEFAGSRVRGQDVFLDLALWKEGQGEKGSLTLRVGKDKPPLSMDLSQSSTAMSFLERGPTSQLVPDRDIGLSLILKWAAMDAQVMLGNGAPDLSSNDSALSEDFEVYARLGVTVGPVYVAASGSYGSESETGTAPGYRSSGRRLLLEASASPEPNPEMDTQTRRRLGGVARLELDRVHAWVEALLTGDRYTMGAWQAGLSVLVHGGCENPWNRLNKPGEIEVAARVAHLSAGPFEDGPDELRPEYLSAALSATWSIDAHLKLIAGYEWTRWDGYATPRSDEHFAGLRLQALVLETP